MSASGKKMTSTKLEWHRKLWIIARMPLNHFKSGRSQYWASSDRTFSPINYHHKYFHKRCKSKNLKKTTKNFVPSTGYDPEVAPFDMNVTLEDISNKEIKGKNESGICLNPPCMRLYQIFDRKYPKINLRHTQRSKESSQNSIVSTLFSTFNKNRTVGSFPREISGGFKQMPDSFFPFISLLLISSKVTFIDRKSVV